MTKKKKEQKGRDASAYVIHTQRNVLPKCASGKESVCFQCRELKSSSIPGWGSSPGGGHGNPLQYSCLENPTDRSLGAATVRRVAKSDSTEVT